MNTLTDDAIGYCLKNRWKLHHVISSQSMREIVFICGEYHIQFILNENQKICYIHSVADTIPSDKFYNRLEREFPELLL